MLNPLPSLRRQWAVVALIWSIVWLAFCLWLRPNWPRNTWPLLSAVALAYGLWVLWRHLPANHRPDESTILPTLGPGNALTLVRGLCIGLLAGFLFGPWPLGATAWIIALLYTITDIADYFDGYLARRSNHVTRLGGVLDIEFDGFGTLVVIVLAISFGQLPWWYLGLGLARYVFVLGLWLRQRLGLPIHDMTSSTHRRVFAGFQMGFLSVVLWPIVPSSMATIAGTIFAAATGLGFLRDWLVAVGSIDPTHPTYRRAQDALYRLLAVWLPPVWRLILVGCMVAVLRDAWPLPPPPWRELLLSWGMPAPDFLALLIFLVALLGTVMVGLGILPRLLALVLLVPIGFDIASRGLDWSNGPALVAVTFIQLLGPGPFAVWPVEERHLFRRLGER